jgi:arginyl-tRNA synthetase
MSELEKQLGDQTVRAIKSLFGAEMATSQLQWQQTRKDFEGDVTLVVFPLLRTSKMSPEQTAEAIGNFLKENTSLVADFNVVKGFLNLVINSSYWLEFLKENATKEGFGYKEAKSKSKVMVEYSSPNTNKPLHLGHLRNNFLGHSIANILEAEGHEVFKVQIINDRGIHICKSMLAWEKYGEGETPDSSGLKGDHLVGKYYVIFDQKYKEEINRLMMQGKEEDTAKKEAPLMKEAQQMLKKWEDGDAEVRALWEKMNGWVYDGFASTYQRMGVDFDKLYYESDTFLIGKEKVLEHEQKGLMYRKEDGSLWVDLSAEGLDDKLLLRADGTSVYMTQDVGTAIIREEEFGCENYYYVVGNEQDYHFRVLALVLQKMGFKWAKGIQHLSYGMVDLPSGKMKSREGTVVDADDLMEEMKITAEKISDDLGKLEGLSASEKEELYEMIGMGALKYFILKVDPKKQMLFDPKESVDFNGNTGPFIQYTHARIQSILRKAGQGKCDSINAEAPIESEDRELVKSLHLFPQVLSEAAEQKSPALIANYAYELVKTFNYFYQNTTPILKESNEDIKNRRLCLCQMVGQTLRNAMGLIGVKLPEQM